MKTATSEAIPQVLRYKGDYIVLVKQIHDFGPEAMVFIDLDGDGKFEYQVCTDDIGVYTFCMEREHLMPDGKFSLYVRSADDKKQSKITVVHTIPEDPYNPASEIPVNKVSADGFDPEPEICICIDCPQGTTLFGSSLDYYRNRYPESRTGRSSNEIRWELIPLARGNLYSYVGNNPATSVDPSGLETYWAMKEAGARIDLKYKADSWYCARTELEVTDFLITPGEGWKGISSDLLKNLLGGLDLVRGVKNIVSLPFT